ncbi:MAG: S8 family peptidase [candidate division WOR-3 bacterium]
MKNVLLCLLMLCMFGLVEATALIDPQLNEVMLRTAGDAQIEVMIVLNEQSDEDYLRNLVADLPRREQRYPVVNYLKELSARTQAELLSYLDSQARANKVSEIQSFWIINAISCKATTEVINEIANKTDVAMITYPYIASENILLTEGKPAPVDILDYRTKEWHVSKVAADSCWAAGYLGQGVIVGLIDTGCNYNHLDLAGHMWNDPNYPNHGWNFELNNNNPIDQQGHGTCCGGEIASNGTAGDSCGIAPQCSLMVCRVRTSIAYPMPDTISEKNVFDAMQFVISPPLSPTHGADVVSMSLGWYVAWTPRRSVWRKSVTNVALAGIPYFIAAGNERGSAGSYCPVPYNLRCPGDVPPPWHHPSEAQGRLAGTISCAAVDNTDALASFSSCGPSCWEDAPWYWDYPFRPGPGILRPDIAAPGVSITSCSYSSNNGYSSGWSGTSMATPILAGVAALLLSKNPNLTVSQIDSIMQFTALDLGTAGKDTMYGAGRVRAKLAIDNTPASGSLPDLRLAEIGTVVLDPAPNGNVNGFFDPSERITLVDTIVNLGSAAATSVSGKLRTTNSHITIIDSTATFGTINPKVKGHNGADPFVLQADTLIQLGTLVPFELELSAGSYTRKIYYQLRMGSVEGPDSAGYFVLDNTDVFYTETPVYNWIEINPNLGGSGTSIGTGGSMVTRRVRSPIVIRHYAKRLGAATTDSISVCSNGWIAFGRTTLTVQHNSILPKIYDYGSQTSAPNMVAAFWDTLNTGSTGSTWWYYDDATNHRFIIQYDSITGSASNRLTFQIIIYDSTLAGPGLKNDIVVQYKRVTEPTTSCTVGQQDSLKRYGITYLFNKVYDTGAAPLASGRAIKFTTKQPKMINWISVDEFSNYTDPGQKRLSLAPNPAYRSINIFYTIDVKSKVSLKVYNVAGQLVRTIINETKSPGVYTAKWLGDDELGRDVSSGVYFFSLEINDNSYSTRGILLR